MKIIKLEKKLEKHLINKIINEKKILEMENLSS